MNDQVSSPNDFFPSRDFIMELMNKYEIPPSFHEDTSDLLCRIPLIVDSEYDHRKHGNKFNEYAMEIKSIRDTIFPPSNEYTLEQTSLWPEGDDLKKHLQACIDILERHHYTADRSNLKMIAICDQCSKFWKETLNRDVRRSDGNIALHDNERFIWDILVEYDR